MVALERNVLYQNSGWTEGLHQNPVKKQLRFELRNGSQAEPENKIMESETHHLLTS